jgi:hypothetical protein
MGRARDISKVFSTGTALATDSEVSGSYLTQSSASTVYQTKATAGLTLLTPTSIANTSGTASIGANGTVSFSGASTVSLNGVFSSAYKDYKFVFDCVGSTFDFIRLRMRASGTDNSSNNYKWTILNSQFNQVNGNWAPAGNTTLQSSILFTYMYNGFPTYMEGIINRPQATEYTSLNAFGNYVQDATTGGYSQYTNGALTVTTSYDGFSLIPASGNMTGSLSVYGYNK